MGCRIDDTAGADADEQIRFCGDLYRALHCLARQIFAKPDDIRTDQLATVGTPGRFCLVQFTLVGGVGFEAAITAKLVDPSVQMYHIAATRPLVKIINVLSDDLKVGDE